jgi:hypothetical protein
MLSYAERIAEQLHQAEQALARDVEEQQRRWRYQVRRGRRWFDAERRRAHRRFRQSIPAYFREANIFSVVTAPLIYSLIVPLAVLDLWVSGYQWVCFPVYGIARVPRAGYFSIDRHTLGYLNGIEKVNCVFCGYANGLIAYVREIAACTEQYWCPIKHARPIVAPHARYHLFLDYGDAEGYRRDLPAARRALRPRAVHGRRDWRRRVRVRRAR